MVTDTIATAKQGDPFEEDTNFAPVATRSQFDTVMGHVDSGHAEGASATTGGRAADVPVDYFVEPTVVAGVTPDMRIAREEIRKQPRSRHEHGVEGAAANLSCTSIQRNTRNQS
jgi:aldehyde dehydrogenase (NAD+)